MTTAANPMKVDPETHKFVREINFRDMPPGWVEAQASDMVESYRQAQEAEGRTVVYHDITVSVQCHGHSHVNAQPPSQPVPPRQP